MLFYYEGRTIRGVGWTMWGLVLSLALVVASGATSIGLALMLGPALTTPADMVKSIGLSLVVACGLLLAELVMVVFFLVGFHQLHVGRHEYGAAHEQSVERALVFLILLVLVATLGTAYAAFSALFGTMGPALPGQTVTGTESLLFGSSEALLAGLTLFYAVHSLVGTTDVSRLRTAVVLGVVGAAAGPAILILAASGAVVDLSSLVTSVTAAVVAGQGVSAISLLLFLWIFRDLRRNLGAGNPAPVLPRLPVWTPWGYAPYAPGFPPQGPPPPSRP